MFITLHIHPHTGDADPERPYLVRADAVFAVRARRTGGSLIELNSGGTTLVQETPAEVLALITGNPAALASAKTIDGAP